MTRVLMLHDCAGVNLTLKQELEKKGYDVDLFFFAIDPYLKYGECQIQKQGMNLAFFTFKKILANYDIIHTYNTRFPNSPFPYDFLFMKALRKKVVVHFHGTELRKYNKRFNLKFLFRNKAIIVATPDLLKFCPKYAEWLPNPVSSSFFHPEPQEPHENIRILHPCTNEKLKGTWILENAISELQAKGFNFDFKIIGERNPVPWFDMPKYYAWSDIVVNELTLGVHSLVGIEAMLCERPVLSSYTCRDVSDAPIIEITPKTLSLVLQEVICNPELRKEYGRKGRVWAMTHHDPERVVERLIEIYESL